MAGGIKSVIIGGLSPTRPLRSIGIAEVAGEYQTPDAVQGVIAWYIPEDGLDGLALSAAIQTWPDQTENGYDLFNMTNPPEISEHILNGHNTLIFQHIASQHYPVPDLTDEFDESEAEIFAVIRAIADPSTEGSGQGFIWKFGTDTTPDQYPFLDGTIKMGTFSTSRKNGPNPVQPLDAWHLLNISSKAGEYIIRRDGNIIFQTATNTFGISATSLIGHSFGPNPGTFYLVEIIIYNKVLTSEERDIVNSYIALKYALTVATTQPPAAPTMLENQSGTFEEDGFQVNLTWVDNATTELTYEVWLRFAGDQQFAFWESLPMNTTIWYDPGTFDSHVQYVVVAKNLNGYSLFSNVVQSTPPAPHTVLIRDYDDYNDPYLVGDGVNILFSYDGPQEWIFPNSSEADELGDGFTIQCRIERAGFGEVLPWTTMAEQLEPAFNIQVTGMAALGAQVFDQVYFRVGAANRPGFGGYQIHFSTDVVGLTYGVAPNALEDFVLDAISELLTWTDTNSNPTELVTEVERTFERGTYDPYAMEDPEVTATDIAGFSAEDYSYRARAVTVFGPGPWAYHVPRPPKDLAGPPTWFSQGARELTWALAGGDDARTTGCKVYRKIGAGAYAMIAEDLLVQTYNDSEDLTASTGMTVYYKVTEESIDGESDFSSEVSGTLVLAVAPDAPSGLVLNQSGWNALSWNDNSDNETFFELHYNFERGTFEEVPENSLLDPDTESIADVMGDHGVGADADFAFRIRAIGLGGESAWAYHVPNTPSGLSNVGPEAPDFYTDSRLIEWSLRGANPALSTGVEIWRKIGAGSFTLIDTIAAGEGTYQDTDDLIANIDEVVQYKVIETSSIGNSGESNTVSGTLIAP